MSDSASNATVLIVDDTPTNLEVLHEVLSNSGYEVLVAVDGESALSQAAYAQPDIILLDVMMPGWDGFETCRRLKEDASTKSIPVIFMTALSETNDKVKGFDIGAVDYITKPLQHQEVLARLQTHLTIRNLQKQLESTNEQLEKRVGERTEELTHLNAVYEKFVPREFIEFLNKDSILDINLGDQIQSEMTVLFSDVQGWTTFSENKTPQESFRFINEYLGVISPIIRKNNGFIEQYYGDGIMALFPGSPNDAVLAAVAIQKRIETFSAERLDRGEANIRAGIGMHTCSLMLGIVGEEERLQGTVISDGVNLASRLEGLTRSFGASILISEQTYEQLSERDRFCCRSVGSVKVKGKQNTVRVYEICDGDADETIQCKVQTRTLFEEGLKLYQDKKFTESSVKFNQVIEQSPNDLAAKLYLERSAAYMVNGAPENWQGIVTIEPN